jgi:hypothetical protein
VVAPQFGLLRFARNDDTPRFANPLTTGHERDMATPAKPKPAAKRRPARPRHLAEGRWYGDFAGLSHAEERLIACCARGVHWTPVGWNGKRPEVATPENSLRAALIRFLVLGGDADHPVHELGVFAGGGWITNELNLHQCRVPVQLILKYCRFNSEPNFMATHIPELALSGSLVPGLKADRINVAGGVFLDEGFKAKGEVRLLGAKIGGGFECERGSFVNANGPALSADRMKVTGDVNFIGGFNSAGEVRLLGATIGGDLNCVKGNFFNRNGYAIDAQRIMIAGGCLLCGASFGSAISLTAARIGTLLDVQEVWASGGHFLDGLHYDRIIGPTDAASRITWLKSQRADQLNEEDWKPQPWEQLIKVLREMGHPAEAAQVAMEKQRMMRGAKRIGTRQPNVSFKHIWRRKLDAWWNPVSNWLAQQFHDLYGVLAGYGHRPTRIVGWMVMLWLAAALCFDAGREFGYFGPSNPLIHASPALAACGGPGEVLADGRPKAFWHTPACPTPPEYSTMQPWVYSLDLVLPLVDLQQDRDWSPIVINENGKQLWGGYLLRALMWFEILFGWFASLMFVAIVSRLVEKD